MRVAIALEQRAQALLGVHSGHLAQVARLAELDVADRLEAVEDCRADRRPARCLHVRGWSPFGKRQLSSFERTTACPLPQLPTGFSDPAADTIYDLANPCPCTGKLM